MKSIWKVSTFLMFKPMLLNRNEMILRLVRSSLWGTRLGMEGTVWSHQQYQDVMSLAIEQAVVGLVAQGLMDSGVRMEDPEDVMEIYGFVKAIRHRNEQVDEAVVDLCRMLREEGIRFLIVKGQTLAALYPDAGLRQSGDIDFLCHPDDWEKAMALFEGSNLKIETSHSEKHVEFKMGDNQYEMHRWLTAFAYPKHHRYWEEVVMDEIWKCPYSVCIRGCDIPTLPPTYNLLYTFVHIFYHLILDGIGLRQFCDWAVLLTQHANNGGAMGEGCLDALDVELLERHLKGIGLRRAYSGLGAILTQYLGMPEEFFPLKIEEQDYRHASQLFDNLLEMGNFGHNVQYRNEPGLRHAVEHLGRIGKQVGAFYHYAPAEALWRIPNMFKWWGIKLWRMVKE